MKKLIFAICILTMIVSVFACAASAADSSTYKDTAAADSVNSVDIESNITSNQVEDLSRIIKALNPDYKAVMDIENILLGYASPKSPQISGAIPAVDPVYPGPGNVITDGFGSGSFLPGYPGAGRHCHCCMCTCRCGMPSGCTTTGRQIPGYTGGIFYGDMIVY